MQRAGRVIGQAQGVAIVRVAEGDPPPIGSRVVDEHLAAVGRVVDVFGPVDAPYLAVTPDSGVVLSSLLSSMLYIR